MVSLNITSEIDNRSVILTNKTSSHNDSTGTTNNSTIKKLLSSWLYEGTEFGTYISILTRILIWKSGNKTLIINYTTWKLLIILRVTCIFDLIRRLNLLLIVLWTLQLMRMLPLPYVTTRVGNAIGKNDHQTRSDPERRIRNSLDTWRTDLQ